MKISFLVNLKLSEQQLATIVAALQPSACGVVSLAELKEKIEAMSLAVENLQAAVAANTSATQSAILLLNQIAGDLRENAADEAAILAIADQVETNAEALAAAVVANTPAEVTEPTPDPIVDEPTPVEPEPVETAGTE